MYNERNNLKRQTEEATMVSFAFSIGFSFLFLFLQPYPVLDRKSAVPILLTREKTSHVIEKLEEATDYIVQLQVSQTVRGRQEESGSVMV